MSEVSHKKKWNSVTVKVHVDPLPIPLIKSKNNEKYGRDSVNIKLCKDPRSEKLYLYELKIALFDNVNPGEFLLFIWNLNMTLEASESVKAGAKSQYLHTLVRG